MRSTFAAVVLALLSGCGGGGGGKGPPRIVGTGFGVTFSPRGFTTTMTADDVLDFYRNHEETGPIIAFHMNWRDDVASAGRIPSTAVQAQAAASQHGFHAVVGFGWHGGSGADLTSAGEPANNTWSNAETRAGFVAMLRAWCRTYRPQFVFVANEVNLYWLEATPQEWADWVSACGEAYDAIKAVSPGTTVFVTFQLERLKGLGVKNGWTDPPQWPILADFAGKVDAMGFTSYPYFEHEAPADLPADYYTSILAYWTGPVIFTEIGWTADPAIPYTGTEQEHVDFIDRFFDLTATLDLAYVTYFLLHDLDIAPVGFRDIGLRRNDGTPRPSLDRWKARIG
jgi:hypothetical protein